MTAFADGPAIFFKDAALEAGVADVAVNSTGPTFVDYDNDGDLDIYVPTEAHLNGHGNRLFENDGAAKFTMLPLSVASTMVAVWRAARPGGASITMVIWIWRFRICRHPIAAAIRCR